MIALKLLGIGNVAAGGASCRSRLVQSCRLYRTCRFLSLFFFLIMPSVFLADTADAAWGTATVDSAGDRGAVHLHGGGHLRGGIYQLL